MDSEVFEQTRSAELASAMQSYQTVKEGYTRLVRIALQQDDPAKRAESLQTIMNENARLTKVVEGLLQMWSMGNEDLSAYSKYKISNLKKELENYKKQLEELKNSKDELTRLQLLNASLQTDFIGGRDEFREESYESLRELLAIMKEQSDLKIEIQGHVCCTDGRDGPNILTGKGNLSEDRAKAVFDYLVRNGIAEKRMRYKGFAGMKKLIDPELSESDQQKNRRVEIQVLSN